MSSEEFLKRASKTIRKSSQIKEKEGIEDPFCRYAKRKGCNPLKLVMLRKKGFPDRTVLCPGGRVFFVEFKRPGESLMGPQQVVKRMLEGLGFDYHLCDQPGQAEEILDKFLALPSEPRHNDLIDSNHSKAEETQNEKVAKAESKN